MQKYSQFFNDVLSNIIRSQQCHKFSESLANQQKNIIHITSTMTNTYSQFTLIFNIEPYCSIRSFQSYLPIDSQTRQVFLGPALEDACQRGLPIHNSQIFYLDFSKRLNVFLGVYPFAQDVRISLQSIINNSIQVNLRSNTLPAGQLIQETREGITNEKVNAKNKKVKERTIKEALNAVRQWREYYDTPDPETGRRLYTLDQAAKKVGIAKKTLDDYYNHLRIAQEHNFNLERFNEEKVGILRRFVKIAKQEGAQGLETKMAGYLIQTNIEKYWTGLYQI